MKYQPIEYQIRAMAEVFGYSPEPAYAYLQDIADKTLPIGAKSLFAVPAWSSIASTYGEAVERVLAMVSERIPMDNDLAGMLSEGNFYQTEGSAAAWQSLMETQSGDILVLPGQLGSLHQGKCSRKARESFSENEFELGVLGTACILLMHPTWKVRKQRCYIDCGDEYLHRANEDKEEVRLLTFSRSDNGFRFSHRPGDLPSPFAGMATGFLQ